MNKILTAILVLSFVSLLASTGCQSANPVRFSAARPVLGQVRTAQITAPPMVANSMINLDQNGDLHGLIDQTPGLVLVDFYADWCGPCKQQSRILDEVVNGSGNYDAKFVKVNIDQHPNLASHFQVQGLPTLVVFKNGSQVSRQTGVSDQGQIAALLSN